MVSLKTGIKYPALGCLGGRKEKCYLWTFQGCRSAEGRKPWRKYTVYVSCLFSLSSCHLWLQWIIKSRKSLIGEKSGYKTIIYFLRFISSTNSTFTWLQFFVSCLSYHCLCVSFCIISSLPLNVLSFIAGVC